MLTAVNIEIMVLNVPLCILHPLLSEPTSSSVGDVSHCAIIRKLSESLFYIRSYIFIQDSSSVLLPTQWSRDSAVGIETGYVLDGRGVGVRVPVWVGFFSSPRRPDRF
jgi:hypothetical protein